MHVISLKKVKTFAQRHSDARVPLLAWHKTILKSHFADSSEVLDAFPQVDFVRPFHVFNVGRGYRLLAVFHFNRKKVFIRHILTHAEYDRAKWKGT